MTEDQFTKLFKYMEQRFDAVEDHFTRVDERFDKVLGILDTHTSRLRAIELELAATNNHLERLDRCVGATENKLDSIDDKLTAHTEVQRRHSRWISQLVGSTSTKLVPEP